MVDEKDNLIVFELLQNCRQPLSKIAKSVKLPQQTVSYRISKLEKDKIIKKYTINIDYQKLGLSRHSLYLDLRGIKAEKVGEYLKTITTINEVSCCYMLHNISNWKIYVSVWTKTIGRYDEIQTKIITKFRIRHLIVWKKHNFGLGWAFRHQYELILVLEKGKPKYNLKDFSDVQTCSHINHNKENHPHEKPVDLITKMILHSSKEGDLILDPFCGSGSVCLACQQTKRRWIGIELDERYVDMANKRIKN